MSTSQAGPSTQRGPSLYSTGFKFPTIQRTAQRPGPVPPRNVNPGTTITTCVATRGFEPQENQFPDKSFFNRAIPMRAEQMLFAIGDPVKTPSGAMMMVSYGDGQREGLVPLAYLQKGTPLRDVKIREFKLDVTPSNPRTSGSVLARTISGLLAAFNSNRGSLLNRGCNILALNLLSDANERDRVRDTICDNIPWELRNVIRNGDASFNDLGTLDKVNPSSDDKRQVIYLWMYDGLPNRGGHGTHGLYAGKTTNLGSRYENHVQAQEPDSSAPGTHYKIARPAQRKKMIIVTDLSNSPTDRGLILTIAEQIFQLLFNTYNPSLFSNNIKDHPSVTARYLADAEAAKSLSAIARTVFQQTGWKVPTGVHGCNWTSALTENQAGMSMWLAETLRDEAGNEVTVFSTGGRSLPLRIGHKGSLGLPIIYGGSDHRGYVEIYISKGAQQGLAPGQRVYPIFEYYSGDGDVAHPVPYARVPEPGPFSDWFSLNRLGLRIEWQTPDGEWRTRYVQTIIMYNKPKPGDSLTSAATFASDVYVKTSLIIDTLMNVEYIGSGKPSYKKSGPPVLVKRFTYDHLHQEIFVKDQTPLKLEPPTLMTYKQNMDIMRRWHPNLIIGDYWPQSGLRSVNVGSPRRLCDFCFTETNVATSLGSGSCPTAADRGDPDYGDKHSCAVCQLLRRPCFFSVDVPQGGAHHGKFPIAQAMQRLFARPERSDWWRIDTPMHMSQGIGKDLGPTTEELDDAAVTELA